MSSEGHFKRFRNPFKDHEIFINSKQALSSVCAQAFAQSPFAKQKLNIGVLVGRGGGVGCVSIRFLGLILIKILDSRSFSHHVSTKEQGFSAQDK